METTISSRGFLLQVLCGKWFFLHYLIRHVASRFNNRLDPKTVCPCYNRPILTKLLLKWTCASILLQLLSNIKSSHDKYLQVKLFPRECSNNIYHTITLYIKIYKKRPTRCPFSSINHSFSSLFLTTICKIYHVSNVHISAFNKRNIPKET